ncbi:MAG: hypothetical protein GX442_06075 [Candidatus Riflebacteria bacterium]|nr:hypothetical protein [Candidatus Riflebacteria bacterium]
MTPPAGSPPGHSPTRTGSPRGPGRKPIPRGDQTCGGSGPAESPPAPSSDRGGDVGGRGWEPIPTSGRGLGGPGPADPFSLFQWLEGVVRCLDNARLPAHPPVQSAAWFSPGEACRQAVIRRLGEARRTADICVFTISDDPVSAAVLAAHRRGVALRVITDDTKVGDRGSDIGAMQAAGIPVVIDDPEAHMHHKFALFDGLWLITGSYNWTRQAALTNDENLVETNDPALLREFAGTFERLWARYGPPPSPARTPG